MEYLGFWVTWDGIQSINKNVDTIVKMMPPKNRRDIREFIGVVNYYSDMWPRR